MQRLHPDESESKEQSTCARGGSDARDLVKRLIHDLSPVLRKIKLND